MKIAAQIEEDILVMQAIKNAFKTPEDVPVEMRSTMPYGFHEYAKENQTQDGDESYLEFDGFQTNTWIQKDHDWTMIVDGDRINLRIKKKLFTWKIILRSRKFIVLVQ